MIMRLPGAFSPLTLFLLLALALAACNPAASDSPVLPTATTAATFTPIRTATRTLPPTATITHTASATHTATRTLTPTHTPTVTIPPTYAILRGRVLMLSNCRYGPGAPYLYKYALIEGSNLEVIGRTDLGTWVLVRAIGGTNPCWVNARLMDIQGDVMSVEPTYIPLPSSPYYGPLTGVAAMRDGQKVTVFWHAVQLRAGDETAEAPYLVEAWLCTDGELVFTPLGSYSHAIELVDEAGCREPSHGRVFLVEKHGYSRAVEIPWPEHP